MTPRRKVSGHTRKVGGVEVTKSPKTIATRFGNFELYERVEYDIYPFGKNIQAIITPMGPDAIGEYRDMFNRAGVSTLAEWDSVDDIRKLK